MSELRLAFPVCCALLASTALAAPLELQVLGVDGKSVGATVVVLRSTDAARPLARPVQATMDQRNRQFEPNVLVVPVGSTVNFPNNDTVQHQVYSFSTSTKGNNFELPLYKGNSRPVAFKQPGAVPVNCNIHDNMHAFIFVVEAQYYGRAAADGIWKSADVQTGTYTVQVWHPRARNMKPVLEQKITVTAAEPRITLRLASKLKLRPVAELPGNWDAY